MNRQRLRLNREVKKSVDLRIESDRLEELVDQGKRLNSMFSQLSDAVENGKADPMGAMMMARFLNKEAKDYQRRTKL